MEVLMKHKTISKLLLAALAGMMILSLAACASLPASAAGLNPQSGRGGPGINPNTTPAPGAAGGTSQGFGQGGGQGRSQGRGQGRGQGGGRGADQGQMGSGTAGLGLASGPLTEAETQALTRAIQEEYAARALYEGVVAELGNVYPFVNIIRSETQHASVLASLAEKYSLSLPAYSGAAQASITTLSEACQASVQAETADAALYDELMADTTKPDLIQVFTNLKNASLTNHLPMFETCK
jgi:hypothetical protein